MKRKISIHRHYATSKSQPANPKRNTMKYFKTLLLLSVTFIFSACDSGSDSGEDSVVNALTGSPNLTSNQTSETSSSNNDVGSYHGRTNGDRPTWYFPKKMSSYPSTFTVNVAGCSSFRVLNNGKRWVKGGYIVKQSDVSGRGLALLAPSSCGSRKATISY